MEHFRWNISQLNFKFGQNNVCGTAVSWFWVKLGVPSDDEKGARRRLVEFLVLNSVYLKKSDSPKTLNREEYDVICGWPLIIFHTSIPWGGVP